MKPHDLKLDWPAFGVPPRYARRWSVIGHTPDHWECTTLFDLQADDRSQVVVHPAAIHTFSMLIDRAAVEMLTSTVETGNACAVPARHAVHGERLLGLRPVTLPGDLPWTDRPADAPPYLGPMELYVQLPDAQIFIIFKRERLLQLATIFALILEELPEQPSAR